MSKNYLMQSNFFTQSVLSGVSEVQKDVIYFLQHIIDFRDENPKEEILFNYHQFLKWKKIDERNFYTPKALETICRGIVKINGVFYNKSTQTTEFFNVFQGVKVKDEKPHDFYITLSNFGKIFFYEKYAIEYATQSKIQYTQIEKSIIDLNGEKRKKLFELLSQYKGTGFYRVSVEKLKILLGLIVIKEEEGESGQLKFLFDDNKEVVKVEYFKRWADFRRSFLDPAIEHLNSCKNLDISSISYTTIKRGRKIEKLEFTFKKRATLNGLTDKERKCYDEFVKFGLTSSQVLFLINRIGYEIMYKYFNDKVTPNPYKDSKVSKYKGQDIYFKNDDNSIINNLGGYLYSDVFKEFLNPK